MIPASKRSAHAFACRVDTLIPLDLGTGEYTATIKVVDGSSGEWHGMLSSLPSLLLSCLRRKATEQSCTRSCIQCVLKHAELLLCPLMDPHVWCRSCVGNLSALCIFLCVRAGGCGWGGLDENYFLNSYPTLLGIESQSRKLVVESDKGSFVEIPAWLAPQRTCRCLYVCLVCVYVWVL
jgi:hypothetical protein